MRKTPKECVLAVEDFGLDLAQKLWPRKTSLDEADIVEIPLLISLW